MDSFSYNGNDKLFLRAKNFEEVCLGYTLEEAVKESMFMAYVDDSTNPVVNVRHLEFACSQIIPLARTMSEKIRGLRSWADDRARRASRTTNQELLPEDHTSIKKTKREKDEDTFG